MKLSDRLRPANHVVQNVRGSRAVLLNMKSGECYELDPIGGLVWTSICAGDRGAGLDRISKLYAVAPDVLERDVLALLEELVACGLLEHGDPNA
jgi:hypothetical protein